MNYKAAAKSYLRDQWHISALVSLVASIIGASVLIYHPNFFKFITDSTFDVDFYLYAGNIPQSVFDFIQAFILFLGVFSVVRLVVEFVFGGVGMLGLCTYYFNLLDGKKAKFSDLFSQFCRFSDGFFLNLLMSLLIMLWSLLLFIPGIIKSLSYSMAPFILTENPELTARQAIRKSKEMMKGNKSELFALNLSFIGWVLLCAVPSIVSMVIYGFVVTGSFSPYAMLAFIPLFIVSQIGLAYLFSYQNATLTLFYRYLKGVYEESTEE